MKNIKIREYLPADKANVLNILRLNTPLYFAKEEEKDFINYLVNEIDFYYVIELRGQVVGCGGLNYSDDPKLIRISWDIIHPDYQGQGLASKLIEHRIVKVKELTEVKTLSVRTSQLAHKFYAKHGFKLKEVVKDYWAKGFDMYRMEIDLSLL